MNQRKGRRSTPILTGGISSTSLGAGNPRPFTDGNLARGPKECPRETPMRGSFAKPAKRSRTLLTKAKGATVAGRSVGHPQLLPLR